MLFTSKVLNKYDVDFYRCNDTGFIQTETPFWLDEAYSTAITKLDLGLPYRNIGLSNRVSEILLKHFNSKGIYLDYAGGYGLFTRLMRDKGFNFYSTDKFCQNLFAVHFDLDQLPAHSKFDVVTAFEVFEHLTDPLTEVKAMLAYSDNLIFSTELQMSGISKVEDWWYFTPETGQHVAFYNEESLKAIANRLGYRFYTDGISMHLFTKTDFQQNPLKIKDNFLLRKAKKYIRRQEKYAGLPESLLMKDWQYVKDKLNKEQ